jgi:AcrR family transcriptional regulator
MTFRQPTGEFDEELDLESGHAPAGPLPRGRHKLSTEAVRASQRARLLRAMLQSVADRGYDATTVPEVVAAARVSRNAFYALFEDKLDCFLALCEELVDQLIEVTFKPAGGSDWDIALRDGTRRYLEWWGRRPRLSRAFLIELPTAGPAGLELRERAFERFRRQFDGLANLARRQDPGLSPLRPTATRLLVGAVTQLVAEEVAAGRTAGLLDLEDDVIWLVTRLIAERR